MNDTIECVVDCYGLHEIASSTSANLKAVFLDLLSEGVVGVPTCVWKEFREIYEDEAAELAPFVKIKISLTKIYKVGAASIADKLNSGFSRGPYDAQTDLYAASIAVSEGYLLLTSSSQLGEYAKMDCEALDLLTWAENLGTAKGQRRGRGT